jgi:apolipoprotein N-acyltransferase
MWLVFPIVWVAAEYARAHVISGFPWFFLAHSQYRLTWLIQVADVTGQYGVSFFVAMVNGAVVDVVLSPLLVRGRRGARLTRQIAIGVGAVASAGVLMLGYGLWRLSQERTSEGPVIGIVQCAFRNSLTGRDEPPEAILKRHRDLMRENFEGSEVDLVLIPETMLPEGLNREVLELDVSRLGMRHVRALAARPAVARLAATLDAPEDYLVSLSDGELRKLVAIYVRGLDVPTSSGEMARLPGRVDEARVLCGDAEALGGAILAGGVTYHYNDKPMYAGDEWLFRNSALWFEPAGVREALYSKMHLVPFSEFVPFKYSWPGMHRFLGGFVPRVMVQLTPGTSPTRFELGHGDRTCQITPAICYEGTFARVCRRIVNADSKDRLILVNLSNDGWFVWRSAGGTNHDSTEQAQHFASYVFRAIETRVPVVRAVNTGISGYIDSNGRIQAVLKDFNGDTMVNGTLLLDGRTGAHGDPAPGHGPAVLVDDRVSLYSQIGDVFAVAVSAAAAALIGLIMLRAARARRASTGTARRAPQGSKGNSR